MVEIVLTDENIQEISQKYKDFIVTSIYCKHIKQWIKHRYKIIGNNYHKHIDKYDLTLQHFNKPSKVHLYEGYKIDIIRSPAPLPGPTLADIQQ
tara:strand:+ start:1452 stop:1733 length:282 start_codon:yes stop_codon:yes gene_type:complete